MGSIPTPGTKYTNEYGSRGLRGRDDDAERVLSADSPTLCVVGKSTETGERRHTTRGAPSAATRSTLMASVESAEPVSK